MCTGGICPVLSSGSDTCMGEGGLRVHVHVRLARLFFARKGGVKLGRFQTGLRDAATWFQKAVSSFSKQAPGLSLFRAMRNFSQERFVEIRRSTSENSLDLCKKRKITLSDQALRPSLLAP